MPKHRIYTTSVASVYPHYVTKAEKKGHRQRGDDPRPGAVLLPMVGAVMIGAGLLSLLS